MSIKHKALYFFAGVLLTVIALYPTLKQTRREQQWGLLMTPEDVKLACGKSESDDISRLAYSIGNRHVELRFVGMNHRWFLQHVNFRAIPDGVPVGDIYQVTKRAISDDVEKGFLPSCLLQAAQ